jgi:hypothetical protein
VAIRKKVPVRRHGVPPGTTTDITLPVFSYENEKLADLIIAAWIDGPFSGGGVTVPHLGRALTDRDSTTLLPSTLARNTARAAVNTIAGMDLTSVVVITEEEHDDDYTMQDPNEVVFVLPNQSRAVIPSPSPAPPYPTDLLETAKLLMACTPNGI